MYEQSTNCFQSNAQSLGSVPLRIALIAGGRFELPTFGMVPTRFLCAIPRYSIICFYTDPSVRRVNQPILEADQRMQESKPCTLPLGEWAKWRHFVSYEWKCHVEVVRFEPTISRSQTGRSSQTEPHLGIQIRCFVRTRAEHICMLTGGLPAC